MIDPNVEGLRTPFMHRLRVFKIEVATTISIHGSTGMDNDLDTRATALCVATDDYLKQHPHLAHWLPRTDLAPEFSDAELVTFAVMQALLGHH